jgi:hypothetical protein
MPRASSAAPRVTLPDLLLSLGEWLLGKRELIIYTLGIVVRDLPGN